jgi:hypothetical protein
MEVHVAERNASSRSKAEVNRIEDAGFPAIAWANQTIDTRRWIPIELSNGAEVVDT